MNKAVDTIFLIDDEQSILDSLAQTLAIEGWQVQTFEQASEALNAIKTHCPGVIITDVKMPDIDGITVLNHIQELDKDIPIILISGHSDIAIAVDAIHQGGYDFLEKPIDPQRLIDTTRRGLHYRKLTLENRRLKAQLQYTQGVENDIIGSSEKIQSLKQMVISLADTHVDILIHGETGTGKELVANCLHNYSARKTRPFVALNCAAVPENIIESELFGHEAGAFTSANKRRIGKLEYASGGTLFLDEIESMPMSLQVRLLRALQERAIERLGSNEIIPVDLRVIAATKKNLLELVEAGKFRQDLYYRLYVVQITIPSLKERKDDIILLFQFFIEQAANKLDVEAPDISMEQVTLLINHDWPGNVRELQHVADRFVLATSKGLPAISELFISDDNKEPMSLDQQVKHFEYSLIEAALNSCSGKVSAVSELLGIPRKKLYLRMAKLGLDKADYRDN